MFELKTVSLWNLSVGSNELEVAVYFKPMQSNMPEACPYGRLHKLCLNVLERFNYFELKKLGYIEVTMFCGLMFVSCNGNEKAVKNIKLDMHNVEPMALDGGELIDLEASDSSLIYDICSLEKFDTLLLVHSRDYLRMYDGRNGKFVRNISRKGKEEDEYTHINNIWAEGDTIKVYDSNRQASLLYSTAGEYLGEEPIGIKEMPGERPRTKVAAPDGLGFYTLNTFTDKSTPTNPKMTYYGTDGKGHGLKGRDVTEGTSMTDGAYTDTEKGRLLVWEPLRDTIFVADREEIRPLYAIDFGTAGFAADSQGKQFLVDRLSDFKSAPQPTASFIRYVQTHGGRLYFTFANNAGTWNLASYDEESGKSRIYHFADNENGIEQGAFFKIIGDEVYMEVEHTGEIEANPGIYKFDISSL